MIERSLLECLKFSDKVTFIWSIVKYESRQTWCHLRMFPLCCSWPNDYCRKPHCLGNVFLNRPSFVVSFCVRVCVCECLRPNIKHGDVEGITQGPGQRGGHGGDPLPGWWQPPADHDFQPKTSNNDPPPFFPAILFLPPNYSSRKGELSVREKKNAGSMGAM